ncbi:GNAT family N-acetyltransferase [Halomontanus rarus]|uniref:GNAT family N-acetyltransferase n=1 Tax=Halomontanus rarus TaxID=3034020 RepID=UPI00307C5DDB
MPSDHDVVRCGLEDIYELAADARDDGTAVKHRPEEQWFRVDDAGFVCLWEPQNRTGTKRISHWWVRLDRRGEGIGEVLLEAAIADAEASDADRLDIYVYDPAPVEARGFEHVGEGQAVDDAQYYEREL